MAKTTVTWQIKQYAKETPEKTAIIVGDTLLNYRCLYEKISAAVHFLQSRGVKKGSHVVSVAKPSFDYIICLYAVLGIGAIQIPVENRIPMERLISIANMVDADFIISEEPCTTDDKWIDLDSIDYNSSDVDWNPVEVSDDCSEIIFTTGTTGRSKGVMLSSSCLDTYLPVMNSSFGLNENSVFLLTTPLNHVGGMHRIHQCMSAGCTIIIMDGIRDLKAFFAYANNYGVTHTYLPPASVKMITTLAKKQIAALDGKLEFIYTASAPFPVKDIETLMELLPHTRLHQGYGSSETGSICNCQYNAPNESIDSLGKPYSCVEVFLEDENGNRIHEPYKAGFIRSRSRMNMLGYYKEPELTSTVLKDGFIYSNDLMFFDEEGNLHFAGRGDDVINIRGFKVAPTEVEDCALKLQDILDCACIPYEDHALGRVMKLLVCIKDGSEFKPKEISAYLSKELEPYKIPQYIETVSEIVRTPNGKMNRKEMIRLYSNTGNKGA